jgi:tRNA pseudouridine55 synthase
LFDTRAVGHAGTLDPAASGVLVVAIGQATKLVSYLTTEEKRYEATVTFGTATTTLDREGDILRRAPIPDDLLAELEALAFEGPSGKRIEQPTGLAPTLLERALEIERQRREQVPPAFSAIKQQGRPAHRRARRGEEVTLAPRAVVVKAIDIVGATSESLHLSLVVSKGYYVRSLAGDLGATLNVPAYLSSLRRTASGSFTLKEALPLTAPPADLFRAIQPLAGAAARVLPVAVLSEEGIRRAGFGKLLAGEHFVTLPPTGASAWLTPAGELVAVGRSDDSHCFAVERGFSHSTSSDAM